MGKTIQMLSLLSADRRKPNLIVAPTVAIIQWKNEIEAHTTGFEVLQFCISFNFLLAKPYSFQVSVWHGQSREKNALDLAKFDIVLTTVSANA